MNPSQDSARRIVMVKKVLKSGAPCAKCAQAEEMLRRRGLWEKLERVVVADEGDEASEGMVLARKYQVDLAPFFLVQVGENTEVLTSVLKLAKIMEDPKADPGESSRSPLTAEESERFAIEMTGAAPERVLAEVLGRVGRGVKIAFSGAEDVALIDMASRSGLPFDVFCLDTGRLHPETYRFIDQVRSHYGIKISLYSPEAPAVEALVRGKGLFSFYQDGHAECCGIRKVGPLRRALQAAPAWITGQRRDQSPTRADVPEIIWDRAHRPEGMLKANPLAGASLKDVWDYLREHRVPTNPLHERGFVSIGCEPCTRPIRPSEHERAGRWWWEEATQRECGLHTGK